MKKLLVSLCCALGSTFAGAALAQADFPRTVLKIIVPFAPGGAPDVISRTLAQKASLGLGREVIVENRTGAGGNLGFDAGAKAPPDGHTLLMCTFGCATNPYLFDKLTWQPGDLAPVMLAGRVPNVLVVHPSLPVRTVSEFIKAAKARQGGFSMASSGVGSASHLAGEMFRSMAGIEVLHVPYKGSTAALPDLAAGRVDFMVVSAPEAMSFIKEGRLHALGTSGDKRASSLPDVPTIGESGVPGYSVTAWAMLVVPAATPAPIVQRLNHEFNAAVSDPDVRRRFGGTPADAAQFLRQQAEEWGRLIKQRNIKAS